jgi:hypothetical protein
MQTGQDRFVIDFKKKYSPYPKQRLFHESTARYRFLGGAAGPGKTACLIVDHMIGCQEFTPDDGKHVHTLLLRRTQPQLESTLVTRFRELIPSELYKKFNQSPGRTEVTWLNGSTTKFGSMQRESDVWGYQGQWWKIGYDELCDFTFTQWSSISPWNRCPVSSWTTKDGAGNPVGIGAAWVRRLFVDGVPCDEMDKEQKAYYNPRDYDFFPCTYLDNPKYANDPIFMANLMSLPAAKREAFMNGSWDVVGGYFEGAFDSAENVCPGYEAVPKPWHRRWLSGDWGMAHNSAIYWHYMDDYGVFRTYDELVINKLDPEELAEMIIKKSVGPDGKMPRFEWFAFSHDAFHEKVNKGQAHTVAGQMTPFLTQAGLPAPFNSGKDALGRETTMYRMLRRRVPVGVLENGLPNMVPNWIISEECPALIECLGTAPRDDKNIERIAEYGGDDPLQGAGYGVYHVFGNPAEKPKSVQKQEMWAQQPERSVHSKVLEQIKFDAQNGHRKPMRGRTGWAR